MKLFKFLREVAEQVRRISWPDSKTVFKLSLTVIVISLISSVILGSADLLFASAIAQLSNLKQTNQQIVSPDNFNFDNLATDSAQATPSAKPIESTPTPNSN